LAPRRGIPASGPAIALLAAALGLGAGGCIYPTRSTSLTPVSAELSANAPAPTDVYRLTILDGQINARRRGDLVWDEGEGRPDAFVRVYRDDRLLFETPAQPDTLEPAWNATVPENVTITPTSRLRFEVWDRDPLGADPVGQALLTGLPSTALPDSPVRLSLEHGCSLAFEVSPPRAQRGVGIESYEVRPDGLVVARVVTHSPAGRAGLAPGDTIIAIGERRVSSMSEGEAATALSMAATRDTQLTVRGTNGRERTVSLDRGLTWVSM
jgi:hypothetical protein